VHAEGERVILQHGESERREIDLVGPQPKPPELPEPLCPMGSCAAMAEGLDDVPEPGTSPIDGMLELPDEDRECGSEGAAQTLRGIDDEPDWDILEPGEAGDMAAEEGGDLS
jgi:hypothetical protein